MNQKNNQRTCILTRKKYDLNQLVRLVKKQDQIIIADNYTIAGRGYYVKKDLLLDNIYKIEKKLKGKYIRTN